MTDPTKAHADLQRVPDSRTMPNFAGPVSFAHLPRVDSLQAAGDDTANYDIAVLGIPYDAGTSYRPGARFGPNHIRQSSRLLRSYNTELEVAPFSARTVIDGGDIAANPFDISAALSTIEVAARERADRGAKVLALGGDHSISLPLLRAVADRYGPVAVLHFDAHLDTWDQFLGESYTHGTPFRRAREENLIDSDRSLHIGVRGPQFNDLDIEDSFRLGYATISATDYDRLGLVGVAEAMMARLGDGPVYVSVDIDVLDPGLAPGTGTPEPGGLSTRELLNTLRALRSLQVVGADLVEVAPPYDHAEVTGYAAAHIGFELISLMALGNDDSDARPD